ncbi:polysaccharide deacetylase [Epidermidibacterium keratini]|uniref:Polysaccharide deacetylase n=1 Tax=Epidermidibacterium keratini TaxID=1891644 RepID=A0A7L4YTS2_9ACTN|nr:polysaccharide deacetylase [Epidermidibacterium keratini]
MLITVLTAGCSTSDGSQSGDGPSATSTSAASSSSAAPSTTPTPTTPPPAPGVPNFPITALAPGQAPPQFIIFSFDGAGSPDKWAEFRAIVDPKGARFTGFLSGTYLLPDSAKSAYAGPGHAPGKSSIGFGGSPQDVASLVATINDARAAGYEIGTHYNGHFCAGAAPSGKDWSTAQWSDELGQFFSFMSDFNAIGGVPGPPLSLTQADIKGGRTPCLEGGPDTLFPALTAAGMQYDTSMVSSGMTWPSLKNGIWEFAMPSVRIPALGSNAIAMDYNFWYKFNQATDEPARAPEFTQMVLDTYRSMYQAVLAGNHAPLVIGNHFNNWSGNAFNPAVATFMSEACDDPGTVCTTYENVLAWMAAQDPAVLNSWLTMPATLN